MTEFKTLFEALAATQDCIKQPKKDSTNPLFNSTYASLDSVINTIVEAKKAAGAKFFFNNVEQDGKMITRINGYGETVDFVGSSISDNMARKGINAMQAEGSSLTYARRYSLCMAFGIASDIDDDGAAASNNGQQQQPRRQQPKLISQQQFKLLNNLIQETSKLSGKDMMAFTLKAANVNALKFVTVENYKPLLSKVTEWHEKAEKQNEEKGDVKDESGESDRKTN